MKGRWLDWNAEELAWIEARKTLPRRILHLAFMLAFDRFEVTEDAIKQLCLRKGWTTGRTGCFVKGQAPPNKGKRCPEGVGGRSAGARRTQFRKGQRSANYRGPGYERVCSKDGYVILVVAEKNPWSGHATRPVLKHKWLWEKKHGPVPKGMCLKCRDGNKRNTDPSNWELISRGALAVLNRKWNGLNHEAAPPELKPAILAIARVKAAASEKRRAAA